MAFAENDLGLDKLEKFIHLMLFVYLNEGDSYHPWSDNIFAPNGNPIEQQDGASKFDSTSLFASRLQVAELESKLSHANYLQLVREFMLAKEVCAQVQALYAEIKRDLEDAIELPAMGGFMQHPPCANYEILALFICKRQLGLARSVLVHKPSRREDNLLLIKGYYPFPICAMIGPDRLIMPAMDVVREMTINRETAVSLRQEFARIKQQIKAIVSAPEHQPVHDPEIKLSPEFTGSLVPFPLIHGLRWEEVALSFKDRETVVVKARKLVRTYNFAELGFKDNRTGAPDSLWEILFSCFPQGRINWDVFNRMRRHGEAKTIMHRIRKRLQRFMQIDENPFFPFFKNQRDYQFRFQMEVRDPY